MPDPRTDLRPRPATARDVPAVVDLVQSAYRGEASRRGWTTEADLLDGQRTDAAAVADALADDDHGCILLFDDPGLLDDPGAVPVACCQLQRRPRQAAWFGMFAVRPGLQGKGRGRAVLAEAERVAVERFGAVTLGLSVLAQRPELIAWYERRGYGRTGETLPFPYGDERYGLPRRDDLAMVVLARQLNRISPRVDAGRTEHFMLIDAFDRGASQPGRLDPSGLPGLPGLPSGPPAGADGRRW